MIDDVIVNIKIKDSQDIIVNNVDKYLIFLLLVLLNVPVETHSNLLFIILSIIVIKYIYCWNKHIRIGIHEYDCDDNNLIKIIFKICGMENKKLKIIILSE